MHSQTINGLMWLECGMQGSGSLRSGQWELHPEKDGGHIITSIAHWGQLFGALEPLKGSKADCDMPRFLVLKNRFSNREESE